MSMEVFDSSKMVEGLEQKDWWGGLVLGLILKKMWENIGKWKLNKYKICNRSPVSDRNSV